MHCCQCGGWADMLLLSVRFTRAELTSHCWGGMLSARYMVAEVTCYCCQSDIKYLNWQATAASSGRLSARPTVAELTCFCCQSGIQELSVRWLRWQNPAVTCCVTQHWSIWKSCGSLLLWETNLLPEVERWGEQGENSWGKNTNIRNCNEYSHRGIIL